MCCSVDEVVNVIGSIGGQEHIEEAGEETLSSATVAPLSETMVQAFDYVEQVYQPAWFERGDGWTGQTYEEALAFCGTKTREDGNPSILCDFQAYCPLGPANTPYGGLRGSGTSWAPISNDHNSWVSVSDKDPCFLITDPNPEDVHAQINEDVTEYVMCCNDHLVTSLLGHKENESVHDSDVSPSLNMAFSYVEEKYEPIWFSREDGWTGTTYDDAFSFCASQTQNNEPLMLCSLQAYCPMGSPQIPYGGAISEPQGSWAPISNDPNWWISVGPESPCMLYQDVHQGAEWGLIEQNDEELTRHIMCCNGHHVESVTGEKEEIAESESSSTIKQFYDPVWFSRGEGWSGTTWQESNDFCATEKSMALCPSQAVCPVSWLCACWFIYILYCFLNANSSLFCF